MAKKADASHPDDHAQMQAQCKQHGVPFEHVEGLARAMAAQAGGRDWGGFAQFIVSILPAIVSLISSFGGGGKPPSPNPNPGPTPPA